MKRILIMLCVVIIALSGCGQKGREGPKEIDYRTGTDGLTIEFPVDLPDQAYENDRYVKFVVEVRNKGAFPQGDYAGEFEGYLWIGGYDQDIINIEPYYEALYGDELEGKSPYNERGGSSAVEFNANIYSLPSGTPYYKPTIIFTATYLYKTIANPIVCIDPEPRSASVKDKVCTIEDITLTSQGAPIAITKVEEDVTSSDILFKISLQNAGNGLVIPMWDVDKDPNEGYDWRDLNEVMIDYIGVGRLRMDSCRPGIGDRVELVDGKGYIFCKLSKSSVGDRVYTTPLNIELSYGYSTSESRSIEIFEEAGY